MFFLFFSSNGFPLAFNPCRRRRSRSLRMTILAVTFRLFVFKVNGRGCCGRYCDSAALRSMASCWIGMAIFYHVYHDPDRDPDRDPDHDHDPDPDRDRDRDLSYPSRIMVAIILFLEFRKL